MMPNFIGFRVKFQGRGRGVSFLVIRVDTWGVGIFQNHYGEKFIHFMNFIGAYLVVLKNSNTLNV